MIYRCDELVLEQLGFVQAFKQLTEGSKTLQTDVKFKDALPVDGRPVLVTMNGCSPRALLKFHPGEFEAIENRCMFIQMDEPIKSVFTDKQLDQLREGAHVLCFMILLAPMDDIYEGESGIEVFS